MTLVSHVRVGKLKELNPSSWYKQRPTANTYTTLTTRSLRKNENWRFGFQIFIF